MFGGLIPAGDPRQTRVMIWSLIHRLTNNGTPVGLQDLEREAMTNHIDIFALHEALHEFEEAGDLEAIGAAFLPRGARILGPGGQIQGIPANTLDRDRAQSLATMIQSQDGVTWLVFSLAITTEAVLLAAFVQADVATVGRFALTVAGIALALIFRSLVRRSNVDMSNYYDLAAFDYPDTFHFPAIVRTRTIARNLMSRTLVGLAIGWILLFLYIENVLRIAPFH